MGWLCIYNREQVECAHILHGTKKTYGMNAMHSCKPVVFRRRVGLNDLYLVLLLGVQPLPLPPELCKYRCVVVGNVEHEWRLLRLARPLDAAYALGDSRLWRRHHARVGLALVEALVRHAVAAQHHRLCELFGAHQLILRCAGEQADLRCVDSCVDDHRLQTVELRDPVGEHEDHSALRTHRDDAPGDELIACDILRESSDHDAHDRLAVTTDHLLR